MTSPSHEPHPKNGHVRLPNEVVEVLGEKQNKGETETNNRRLRTMK